MNPSLEALLGTHLAVLDITAYRQQLLAHNIAHAQTPGVKPRDVNFDAALGAALERQRAAAFLVTRDPRHLQGGGAFPLETYSQPRALPPSGVDLDAERGALAENAQRYEASLAFIDALMRNLRYAIKGGPES